MIGVKLLKNKYKSALGFSLVEIMISVSLFTIIILSATSIFKIVIDSQRNAMAAQNVQENIKYFLEAIGKEIRMAQRNGGVCPAVGSTDVFTVTSDGNGNNILNFKNYYGECVAYFLAADGTNKRFSITRGANTGFISPAMIRLDNLYFIVRHGDGVGGQQNTVTINLKAHALNNAKSDADMQIQTSISSRYYK